MTNKLKHFEQPIAKLLEARDFNSLLNLFASESFQFNELIIFYKRNDKIFNFPEFWTSDLPHFFLEEIFKSDLKVDFLRAFLSKNGNGNESLFQHIALIAKPDLIRHIKIWNAFYNSSFWNFVQETAKNDDEIRRLCDELEIIKCSESKIRKQEYQDELYLLQFDLGEILLGAALYYEKFKQSKTPTNNKAFQIQIETTLVDEITRILSLFKTKGKDNFKIGANEETQKEFERYKAAHFLKGKDGLIMPLPEKFHLLFGVFQRMIDRNSRRGLIRMYLSGLVDFHSVKLNPAILKTNLNFEIFQRNDFKGGPEEFYFIDQIELFKNPTKEMRVETSSEIKRLEFQGVPPELESREGSIDLKKALNLLKLFSVFKGPLEQFFVPTSKETLVVPMNEGNKNFVQLFGKNESISVFDFGYLKTGIQKYFNWSEAETDNILWFFVWDIEHDVISPNWLYKPFLKSGNQIIWLGSFLKDRRWDTILFNKLRQDPLFNNQVNNQTKAFERKIGEVFDSKDFTIVRRDFRLIDGRRGDFDLLAFKDGFLFVIEAKTSLLSNDFSHANQSEAVSLEGCAVEQIHKAMDMVREDWEKIKADLAIPDHYLLDDVKLIPLIVTNHFEGDMKLFGESIRKVSLLEIQVILTNSKKKLLELYLKNKLNTNMLNSNLKTFKLPSIKWDLWNGKSQFHPQLLIDALDSNAVWKEIEDLCSFEGTDFMIDY